MKRLFNTGIASLLMLFVLFRVNAQENQVTKTFHQEYPVTKETKLLIDNKYGAIDVKNWNENKITIDVKVTLENPNKEKAKKLLNYVNIEFSQEGNEVKAVTDIDEKFNSGGNWFHFGSDCKEFSINYTVNLPASLDVTLKNKYGDIFINELTGPVHIILKYGNLKANKILRGNADPLAQLEMGYADASIEECSWMKIDMKYSKLKIENSKALVVVSKYSKLNIKDCSSIVAEAKYDGYLVEKLSNIVVTAGYSDFSIGEVAKKIDVGIRYSDFKVKKVPATFENIKVENAYGGVKILIDPTASYMIDGHARYAKITIPDEGKLNRIEENTSTTISGLVGKDEKTKAWVKIETSYGGVKLIE